MKAQNTFLNDKNRPMHQHGFSLVELMIALVVGLLASMAVYSVMSVNESRKRTTTSVNDIDQAGAYALYQLGQSVRNAGSGLGMAYNEYQDVTSTLGCPLHAARSGSQIMPAGTFPAPFASVSTTVRLAPIVIMDGAAGTGGDVIVSMSGSSGLAEVPTKFSSSASNLLQLNLENIVGYRANDLVLLLDAASTQPCFISQVNSTFTAEEDESVLPLAGTFYQATIGGNTITSANTFAVNLGQSPAFTMLGVGSNNTLYKYDLFRTSAATAADANPAIFVENIYQMQALYGVDIDGNDAVASITWVPPTGNYAAANLLNGTSAASARLATIKAIKIGLVLRSDLDETKTVSNSTLTLFSDTTSPITVNLNPVTYRYRAFEATIPLRNNLL
jgi:type IV pilus assembly protein PilW